MDELKELIDLISYIVIAILCLPFILLTMILIYILKGFEVIWKDIKR